MGDGAEIGITGNAGGELLLAVGMDLDFAEKLHLDLEVVVLLLAPAFFADGHGISKRHDTVLADGNGDQPADRPEFREIGAAAFGDRRNGGARTVARNDPSEKAVAGVHPVATIAFSGLAGCLEVIIKQRRSRYGNRKAWWADW